MDEDPLNNFEVSETNINTLEANQFETEQNVAHDVLIPIQGTNPNEKSLKETNWEKNCLYCSTRSKQIGVHLASSDDCRRKYCEKLKLSPDSSVKNIMKARKNVRRETYPSRKPESRALETLNRKMNQDDVQLYNTFKRNINKTTNLFKCNKCRNILKREDVQKDAENLTLPVHLKREDSFWVCRDCVSGTNVPAPSTAFLKHFNLVVVDGRNIFIPASADEDVEVTGYKQNFLIPCSTTSQFSEMGSREPIYRQDVIKKMFAGPGQFKLKEFLSPLYEHKMKQLIDASNFSSCVNGRIVDFNQRSVRIVDSHMTTSKIKGSDDYYSRLNQEIRFAIYNLGSTFVEIKAKLPKNTEGVWASILMQINNAMVDVLEKKNEDGMIETQFKVHTTHNSDGDCDATCEPVDLVEFRNSYREELLYGPLLPACVNSIHLRFNQLVTLVSSIQSLKSQRYHSSIQFPVMKDSAELVMIMWPDSLCELNRKMANSEALGNDDRVNLCSFLDKNLTASLDKDYISETFQLSYSSASTVAELALTHQYHHHQGVKCSECFPKKVPSNLTLMKDIPRIELDKIATWVRLNQAFKEKLENLPSVVFLNTSEETLDGFLHNLEQSEGYSLVHDGSFYRLKLHMYPVFFLKVDDVLVELIQKFEFDKLSAIYHRCISVSSKSGVEYVLRRPFLRDCSILEYTPLILLASESTL